MQITSHTSATITTETYFITTEQGPVVYTEYLNDKGKVIDCTLRDDDGNNIDDAALLEQVQQFVDNQALADEQQRRDEKNGLVGDKTNVVN